MALAEEVEALEEDYTGPDIPEAWRAGYLIGIDAAKDAIRAALQRVNSKDKETTDGQ